MRQALLRKIAAMISQFLPEAKPREFQVPASGLAFVGYPWRGCLRTHATTADVWLCRLQDPLPGGLATLVLPTMVGKLAYVRKVCRTLDRSAFSASIDLDQFLFHGKRVEIARQ